jgi:hypothetical protein
LDRYAAENAKLFTLCDSARRLTARAAGDAETAGGSRGMKGLSPVVGYGFAVAFFFAVLAGASFSFLSK